jgi:ABC-type cobalamin/Fe3+-siderophores transport system ATPase subunit
MLVAMFRLVELLEKQQDLSARKVPTGRILIDGVDIATVGLHTLRRRITIIPQVSALETTVCLTHTTTSEAHYLRLFECSHLLRDIS